MENKIRPTNNHSNAEIINIREIVLKYLRNWYWFVISVVLCLIPGYFYLKVTTPKYKVQTTILLRQEKGSSPLSQMALLQSMGMSGSSKDLEE